MNSSRTLFIEIKMSKLMNYWTMVIGYGQMLTPRSRTGEINQEIIANWL
jgi:hypothetical protein